MRIPPPTTRRSRLLSIGLVLLALGIPACMSTPGDDTYRTGSGTAGDACAPDPPPTDGMGGGSYDAGETDDASSVMSPAKPVPCTSLPPTDGAQPDGGSGPTFDSDDCHACSAGACQPQRTACSNDPACKSAGSVAEDCVVAAQTSHGDEHACLATFAVADATAAAMASCLESKCAAFCF
jgi:hypothetical protein